MKNVLTLGVMTCLSGLVLFAAACSDDDADPATDAGVDAGTDTGVTTDSGSAPADAATVDAGPPRVNYTITSVTGTFTGDGVNVVDTTRTDTLAANTCTYQGTAPTGLFIGIDGGTPQIQVSGTTTCPAGNATSTGTPPTCTAGATTANATLFQGTIEAAGWNDDSVITFKITAPPSGMPACNNATVVIASSQPWGIQGTTTAAKFKALKPFDVVFKGPEGGGTKTLVSGTNTSKVSWNFTMTVAPTLP